MLNNTSPKSRNSKILNWAEAYAREGMSWDQAHAIAGCTGHNIERLKPRNTTPALEAAMALVLFREWKVFPARMEDGKKWSWLSKTRAPGGENWGMTDDPAQLLRNFVDPQWRLKCGVGVPTGAVNGIFDIEADTLKGHGKDGLANLKALEAKHGKLPDTLMAKSPSGSVHRIYRHPGRGIKVKSSDNSIAPGVDIKGDGGMFVAPPSVRADGAYEWLNNLPIADAPQWLLDLVCENAPENSSTVEKNEFEKYGDELRAVPLDKIAFMLRIIPNNDAVHWNVWNDVGMATWDGAPNDDGGALFDAFSQRAPKYHKKIKGKTGKQRTAAKWKAYFTNPPTKLTVGKLFYLADRADPDWRDKYEAERMAAELAKAKQDTKKKLPWMVELGSKLWGPVTVSGKEYRFGADQSKVIDPGKGVWFDFSTNKGGGLKELMKKIETANRAQQVNDVVIVCASDVEMRRLDWIWEGHLLRGSQELLSGLSDLGKSQVQIAYIACATTRLPWPDGKSGTDPVNVVMLTAEDTLDQIVKPRLLAAGADVSRVHFLKCIKTDEHDRQFLLAEDLHRLERTVKEIGSVGLITVDPITAYMGGKVDSHKATDVRAQLGPLSDFAERINIAISTITHPAKSAGPRALDHFIGSQAFIANCRIGHLCIAEMEEDDDGERYATGRVLFTNVRNSVRPPMPTLAYRKEAVVVEPGKGFEEDITAPRVVWQGKVDITADAAVAAVSGKKSDAQVKLQAFLRELLRGGKKVAETEIEEAAGQKGFSKWQLRTAKEKLGIQSSKEEGKLDGGWFWHFPVFENNKPKPRNSLK